MKTIKSHALVLAIASVLGASAHAQSGNKVSWGAYRSIVNPSVEIEDSFNRSTDIDTRIATDNSRSATGSFNRSTDIDTLTVAPKVRTNESIATLDTQTGTNSASMSGPTQYGSQGDFSLNMGGGQPASARGGLFGSDAEVSQRYDAMQRNFVSVDGDNNGLIRAQNALNIGGSQINDSDLGNKQSFYAGDQTQVQGVTQDKRSATQTNSNDVIATSVRR